MTELISDKKKFKKLTNDPTIKREQALQRTLRKLNKKTIFSESEYSDLYPKGSKIARLYGTPKIHKSFSSGSIPPVSSGIIRFIHYVCFYSHEKCQIKVFKCIFNDTVTLQQIFY